MNISDKEYDDLTAIKGIREKRQQRLRDLGIYTYQDLVDQPANQLESRLKAEGPSISQKTIGAWQAQAKEFAGSANSPPVLDLPEENEIVKSNLIRDDGWKPFASFVLEFQTREIDTEGYERRTTVHYMEEDTGTVWPGIVGKQLCTWILEQINEPMDMISENHKLLPKGRGEDDLPVESPAKVVVQDILLFQPPNADEPAGVFEDRKPFIGSVKGNTPFTLEVSFDITGKHVERVIEQGVRCLVQSYAYEWSIGDPIHLGDGELINLKKGKFTYTFRLPEITLTCGTYRFWVLVGLDNGQIIPNYIEVPALYIQ